MALPATIEGIDDHGGNIGRARALFAHAPEPWVDLSTGINPHPYPLFDLPATAFSRLPEPGRLADLLAAAATGYAAPSRREVVAAPGTQILLPRVMALVPPGIAKVLGPTYAEHSRTAALAGHRVEEATDFNALVDADVAVVVNPNNPDGRLISRDDLLDLAGRLARHGGLLVVDEAFMDVGPSKHSVTGEIGRGNLVVLRSFGKFYGMAGIRLGFAVAAETLAKRLAGDLGPWAVSGPAIEIGVRALGDSEWRTTMLERLRADSKRLDALLAGAGFASIAGTSLYRFLDSRHAPALFAWLGRCGILVRNFSWSQTALRLGLPGGEADWQRLDAALCDWKQQRLNDREDLR